VSGAARARAASVLALSALFALVYGLRYGVHNQHTYLLRAARAVRPELFGRDWLVAQATDYHPLFSALAALLMSGRHPGWALALANVALLATGAYLFYRLAREAAGPAALPAFLLVIGWPAFAAQHEVLGSVAVSALFTNYFVPANLGSLGLLAALVLHVRGRFLWAGLAAGAAGLFHANYLVLAPPLLLLAHALHRPSGWRPVLAQLAPCAAVVLLRLPELLAVSSDPLAAEGRRIFMTIRSPHHYVPLTFLRDFVPFLGWCLMGVAAWRGTGRPESDAAARLRALFVSVLALVSGATLLTTVVYVPAVAQLYVWRLAPFGVLLALVSLASWLSRGAPAGGDGSWPRRLALIAVMAAAASAIAWRAEPTVRAGVVALAVSAALAVAGWFGPRSGAAVGLMGAALLALGFARGLAGLRDEAAALDRPLSREEELYRWAQTTPVSALFAIPPDLGGFRLSAERAAVVDWKSTPAVPSEVCEWYRRVRLVAGQDDVTDPDSAVRGYQTMGPWRIARLREELGVDYIVLRSPFPRTRLPEYPVAFQDERFIVFDVRRPAPLPSRR
jgi:hypothetical protein